MAKAKEAVPKAVEWANIIKDQEESGLSATKFCEKNGFGLQSFYTWKRKLSGEAPVKQPKTGNVTIELNGAKISCSPEDAGKILKAMK